MLQVPHLTGELSGEAPGEAPGGSRYVRWPSSSSEGWGQARHREAALVVARCKVAFLERRRAEGPALEALLLLGLAHYLELPVVERVHLQRARPARVAAQQCETRAAWHPLDVVPVRRNEMSTPVGARIVQLERQCSLVQSPLNPTLSARAE